MPHSKLKTCRRPGVVRGHWGLTLVELIVVLVVLVALGGLIVPLFSDLGGEAQDEATRATMSQVAETIVGPGGYVEVMKFARNAADTEFIGEATGLPWPSPAEIAGGRANHPQLHYLFEQPTDLFDYDPSATATQYYDPLNRIGWRGEWLSAVTATPYDSGVFSTTYGEGDGRDGAGDDDLAPLDGWGNPVVIQLPNVTAGSFTDEEIGHVRLVSAGPDGEIDTPTTVLTPTLTQKDDDVVLYLYREDPNL
ncbi:MAG: hypothetical protein AAGA25_08810 [Planctomycetota bacterium]